MKVKVNIISCYKINLKLCKRIQGSNWPSWTWKKLLLFPRTNNQLEGYHVKQQKFAAVDKQNILLWTVEQNQLQRNMTDIVPTLPRL